MILDRFADLFLNDSLLFTLRFLYLWAPLWLPIFLCITLFTIWKRYTVIQWIHKNVFSDYLLLEIVLPREITKTPLAMETVLMTLHQTTGETTFIDRFWFGKRRTWFSLELVSLGGEVHFYIWMRAFYKNIVESALYGQYPDIEVHEAEDYPLAFGYDPEKNFLWGCEFQLNKPDPYPIKTYIDYGLDKPAKEEEKTDPLTSLLEYLGSCDRSGQIWIQILIQAHSKPDRRKPGGWFYEKERWDAEARRIINDIMRRNPETKAVIQPAIPQEGGVSLFPMTTTGEREQVAAIERSINKPAFNSGIRGIYISDKEHINGVYIVGLIGCLKQFNAPDSNTFGVANRVHYEHSWAWQDFNGYRYNYRARRVLDYYKRRAYFHPPYTQRHFVLTAEELATLFHLPGTVATTPTLTRISSKRGQAPTNLPV